MKTQSRDIPEIDNNNASKAFDRVNHFSLFAKLSNRGIPQCYSNFVLLVCKSEDVCSLGWDLFFFFLCY